MIARLLVGGIVVFPIAYARPPLTPGQMALCVVVAFIVALLIPEDWQD